MPCPAQSWRRHFKATARSTTWTSAARCCGCFFPGRRNWRSARPYGSVSGSRAPRCSGAKRAESNKKKIIGILVGAAGFEPPTPSSRTLRRYMRALQRLSPFVHGVSVVILWFVHVPAEPQGAPAVRTFRCLNSRADGEQIVRAGYLLEREELDSNILLPP